MTLTLELATSSAATAGDAVQRSFDEQGGTIGRAPSNTWVLTHNKVSGHHAVISFRNGVFYIEDTSRNGVAVNSMENRLVRNRPYALKTGDRIFIEPYEIGVWIQGQPAAAAPARPDPFAEVDPFAAPGSGWPLAAGSPELPTPGDVVDPLLLIPGGEAAARKGTPPPVPADDPLAQHYQPPPVVAAPSPVPAPAAPAIPAGYNPLDDAFSEPPAIAPPRRPDPPRRAPVTPLAPPPTPVVPAPPARSARAPVSPVPDDPFADPPPDSAGSAAPGPVPAAPLDLDALTGPPPVEAPTAPPVRPRPGMDSQARRRPKEPLPDDPRTVRFPVQAPDVPGAPPAVAPPSGSDAPVPSVPPPPVAEPERAEASSAGPVVATPPAPAAAPVAEPRAAPVSPVAAAPAPSTAPPSSGAPVPPAPAVPGSVGDLSALMAGAGLPGGAVTPELSRDIGHILRVVVEGLMDVLQSRQKIKEEFGMQPTVFRPLENNPLKFSANLEDALHNLFVKHNPAYLGSVDAFREAFDDLRDHQLAVLAGLRVAFDAMLAEFDPDRLQERFDTQVGKGALPLMPAKMRYWDMFRTYRADLAKDPEAAFERLFGEEFRRAYEKQFRDLKAQRRSRGGRSGPDPAPRT